jgi:two-component system phosphate regulon sensor histidine kinase PhoR
MFETKNFNPVQISFLNAIVLATTGAILALIGHQSMPSSAVVFVIIFITCFFLTKYLINVYIKRKIKLIYKFIHQTKASKREEFFKKKILPQQSLDEVAEEVLQWADQRKAEMEVLEKNEIFRKEFLQNLSHEFKTPAFAIQGYLETLLAGAIDNPEVNKKFLGNAFKNTERLIHLINDLDEITKLESGKLELHFQNFVIQDLILEVFEALSFKAEAKRIRCSIKKACEQPVIVDADKEKIRQVLINFVDNAIKYGNVEGRIEASVYKTEDGKYLVEISDNGIGIAEEHLPRIFERFYRTDYGRSRNIGGSGLGLSICKHIIEAHGQIIHVRSKPVVGSTFGFTLKKQSR